MYKAFGVTRPTLTCTLNASLVTSTFLYNYNLYVCACGVHVHVIYFQCMFNAYDSVLLVWKWPGGLFHEVGVIMWASDHYIAKLLDRDFHRAGVCTCSP